MLAYVNPLLAESCSQYRLFIFLILSWLMGMYLPLQAFAATATDYTCLKGCIEDGQTYAVCMPKCSYDSAAPYKAHPHMEYSCLKSCMDNGGAAPVCVPHCTSAPQSSSAAPQSQELQTHDVVKAPVPFSGTLLHTPTHAQQAPYIDYNCLNLCAKGGLAYQLCSERCAK